MPSRVVVMGVAGSGKTAIGRRLAGRLGVRFIEGDDLHPAANVAKMTAGIPLDDDDRQPWLERLVAELASSDAAVATCSALKRAYRDVLRTAGDVTFVHLEVGRATIERRVGQRRHHFMRAEMVDSQFAAFEPIEPDEDAVIVIDGDGSIAESLTAVLVAIERQGRRPG